MQTSASLAGAVGRGKMKSKPKTKVRGKSDFIDMEMNRPPKKAPGKKPAKKGKR